MVIVLGTTTLDLMLTGIQNPPRLGQDEFTSSNLSFLEEPLLMSLGGNGANSAFMLARLGMDTALFSARGEDPAGRLVADWLIQAGVDITGLRIHPDLSTATTSVLMDPALNRQAYYHPGALTDLSFKAFPLHLLDGAEAALISGYTLLPNMRPNGYAQLLKAARERDLRTAMDLGPAIGELPSLAELNPVMENLDLLLCNEYELQTISELQDISKALDAFFEAGAPQIVLKQGDRGASWHVSGREPVSQSAFPIESHVTIGAGDTFNSAFMLAWIEGFSKAEALQFANAAAALVVASPHGILGGPDRNQVEAFLQAHRPEKDSTEERKSS